MPRQPMCSRRWTRLGCGGPEPNPNPNRNSSSRLTLTMSIKTNATPNPVSACYTPSLPAAAQMPLPYLLLPQCCRIHSTPLYPTVRTKHLTLTLSLPLTILSPKCSNAIPALTVDPNPCD